MKKIIKILVFCFAVSGFSQTENYVSTYTAKTETTGDLKGLDYSQTLKETQYYDDLGRPFQQVVRAAGTSSGIDNVSVVEYDALGRVSKNFLPYTVSGNNGDFRTDWENEISSFYNDGNNNVATESTYYYSENVFESSSLNKVLQAKSPGSGWRNQSGYDRPIQFTDDVNTLNDEIAKLNIQNYSSYNVTYNSYYADGELDKATMKDENFNISNTYTNSLGQVILKEQFLSEGNISFGSAEVGADYVFQFDILVPDDVTDAYVEVYQITQGKLLYIKPTGGKFVSAYIFHKNSEANFINLDEGFYPNSGVIIKNLKQIKVNRVQTYYIYDDFNNLAYVVPPQAVTEIKNAQNDWSKVNDPIFRKKWMYSYTYDNQKRLIEKQVPGAEPAYIIYDERDRPVLTQNGNQRRQNSDPLSVPEEWNYTKYDALNRPVLTGLLEIANKDLATLRTEVQASQFSVNYTGSGNAEGYEITTAPGQVANSDTILTVNYYDDYNFTNDAHWSFTSITNTPVKGFSTGSKIKILGTTNFLESFVLYDDRYRVIEAQSQNQLNGTDIVKTTYKNLVNSSVTQVESTHKKPGAIDVKVTENFTYDHMERLLTHTHQINNHSAVTLVDNTYNNLGELIQKEVGGGLQSVNYKYNVRGWLKTINNGNTFDDTDDLFGMELKYEDAPTGYQLYNGNIGEIQWKNALVSGETANPEDYTYTYDALNRIKAANYSTTLSQNINQTEERNTIITTTEDVLASNSITLKPGFTITATSGLSFTAKIYEGSVSGSYNVDNITYDANGNILTLDRDLHSEAADRLTYQYNGNQLNSVGDAGTNTFFNEALSEGNMANEYVYDANGNMLQDLNKGISNIIYNHLNLPTKVTFASNKYIEYTYDATGIKTNKKVTDGVNITNTAYTGNFIYENGTLKFFNHAEGYIEPKSESDLSQGFNYIYQYKDHLGNIRLSYQDIDGNGSITASTEILQERNFYPFGLEHKGYNSSIIGAENNRWTYQGQELTKDLGLNVHEWKYRISDPAIGRFWQIDPLAEDYYHNGTYNFSENRVIDAWELEGLEARVIVEEGNYAKANVGHTFVSVGSGKNQTVYTYGRWAGTEASSGSSHSPLNNGPGVMVKLTGDEARAEISKYVNDYGAQVFELTNVDESQVQSNLESEFNKSTETPGQGKYEGDNRAHVIDNYELTSCNCTTKSLDAVESGNGNKPLSYKTTVSSPKLSGGKATVNMNVMSISPADLSKQLNTATKDSKSGVIDVTNTYKKDDE